MLKHQNRTELLSVPTEVLHQVLGVVCEQLDVGRVARVVVLQDQHQVRLEDLQAPPRPHVLRYAEQTLL